MSAHDRESRLPGPVEELLGAWPMPELDEAVWEQRAVRTLARLEQVAPGSTEELWLAPPLPPAEGEPGESMPRSQPRVARRPEAGPSLADIARASVAKSGRDASALELAKASLSLSTQSRQDAAKLAERLRRDQESRPSSPPPERTPSRPVAPGAIGFASAASTGGSPPTAAVRPEEPRAPRRWAALAFGTGVMALAAAAALVLMRPGQTPVEPAAAQRPLLTAAEAAAEQPAPAAVAAAPTPAPAPAAADEQKAMPAEALAPERVESPAAVAVLPRAAVGRSAPPSAAATPPAGAAKAAPNDELPPDPRLAAAAAESRSARPSQGAVMAAVGSVMGGARACVSGHQEPSKATLTFGNDGRVRGVQVTGPAAGTPAEACIRASLMGARVQPFAEDVFTVAVPIRP